MSERSQEVLSSYIDGPPPEIDSDAEVQEERIRQGLYEASKIEVIDSVSTGDFKYTWINLKSDIVTTSIKEQVIFAEQIMEKISEVYSYEFPWNPVLESQGALNNFYEYIEFLEYNNSQFLSFVWMFVYKDDRFLKLDIEKYSRSNSDKIIKEVVEQLELHPQTKYINMFLRTYYKDGFIEWFIKNTNKSKNDIALSLLERKGQ